MKPAVQRVSAERNINASVCMVPKVTLQGGTHKAGRSAPALPSAEGLKVLHRRSIVLESAGSNGGVAEDGGAVDRGIESGSASQIAAGPSDPSLLHHPEPPTSLRRQRGAS